MIEAVTYTDMIKHIEDNDVVEDVVGILLTRPDLHTGEDIINSLNYYHHLTSKNINFYLPRFGAFWSLNDYPDMRKVTQIDGVEWSFSFKAFVEFVLSFEELSTWQYSGESELLLIPYYDDTLDFSEVGIFHLDAMLDDGTISSVSSFITVLSRCAKRDNFVFDILVNEGVRCLAKSVIEEMVDSLPKYISKPLNRGKHYLCRDFSL